jgi:hypothetical protein
MPAVRTIGLDIAKSVFRVHGIDAAGNVLIRRQTSADEQGVEAKGNEVNTKGR